VRFARATPQRLRAAVTAVLDEPAYRTAAGRVGASFAAAGGAPAAAAHLARLAGLPSTVDQGVGGRVARRVASQSP
jgi:zeaxanthin glucosyltransferase